MSGLHLYDDATARTFEPFALTRPASELTAGVALIRERWIAALGLPAAGRLCAAHLDAFEEPGSPAAAERIAAGSVVVNARFAPRLRQAHAAAARDVVARAEDTTPDADVWTCSGRVVAVRASEGLDAARFADGSTALEELAARGGRFVELEGWWIDVVWDLVRHLPAMLAADIPYLQGGAGGGAATPTGAPPAHVTVLGEHPVLVAQETASASGGRRRGATIEPHVVLDATAGPIYVGAEATVRAFSRITGPCYIGPGATVMGGDVTGCSIGELSKVRGEISSTVLIGHSNKGHDGFVGHSYLGRWVNLGAGTVTSNLKNTYGAVSLWTPAGVRDTGLQFLGTLFGDHARTGIGLRLTTGTVLGAGANVYDAMPPKVVAPFSWGGGAPYGTYRLDKFLEVAERVMSRRHVELTAGTRAQLAAAHAAASGRTWRADAGTGA